MGYFDTTDPAAFKMQALSQALLGLGAGMLGQGATPYPQSFLSSLARGGAGFASGLQQGVETARRDRLLGLEEQRQGTLGTADVVAPILAKMARGEAITAGEQKALDTYKSMNPVQTTIRDGMAGGQTTENRGQMPPAAAAGPAPAPVPPPSTVHRPPSSGQMRPGSAKEAPLSITDSNGTDVIGSIWASGMPLWVRWLDGTVDQATPEQAEAWLQQHGLLK
jgi:hypothetical protein